MIDTTPLKPSYSTDDATPLMKQYWELKSQVPDALLLFRMGDFYELFGDDAVSAANILEITLTSRDKNKPNPMPMAGVPHHSIHGYIQKLLKVGKKVAIGEQVEDPELAKGAGKIVRREIVRVLTPGVQFDSETFEPHFLCTILKADSTHWVLACLEASTGEALISDPLELDALTEEWKKLPIRHYLQFHPELEMNSGQSTFPGPGNILFENLPKNYLLPERAKELLQLHYGVSNLEAFFQHPVSELALGILVTYVLRTQQQSRLAHLQLPQPLLKPKAMILGPSTAQHLDLEDLFQWMNQTRSSLGARQLKKWLFSPLTQPVDILERQKAIQELAKTPSKRDPLSQHLGQVYDIERICGRIATKLANPKDTLALGQSLSILLPIQSLLGQPESTLLRKLQSEICDLQIQLGNLCNQIITTQKEDAPLTSRDGGIFKSGTHPELDRLISLTENGQRWLVELEARERETTGIPSLKVRYNRVFGYYIEVTQAHLKNVPAHYQRKQTMVGAERFFTEELKKFEEEILTASTKQKSLEQELFQKLIDEIQVLAKPIMEAAKVLAEVDVILSLGKLTTRPGWTFPQINEGLDLRIEKGQHPLVAEAKRGYFVPNDVQLSPSTRRTLLITGPNMGGKSTVMRQTALIVILGQMGSAIPAAHASWGAVSSVYTRIGAQDAIARGQSTFMVEMSELAHILHHANERSLIILDEIGRGTSTYDGISVAWATLEWICKQIQARTLFATHYHELIHLDRELPSLANAHMAAEVTQGSKNQKKEATLRFLYELREGPTNESFGIHVAQLAGLPKKVTDQAWKVLEHLENQSSTPQSNSIAQLPLFSSQRTEIESIPVPAPEPELNPVLENLKNLKLDHLTPLQALNMLSEFQKELRASC